MPRCRRAASADQLGVARNTVVLAYQMLVEEGYLISRERSGHFVNPKMLEGLPGFAAAKPAVQPGGDDDTPGRPLGTSASRIRRRGSATS